MWSRFALLLGLDAFRRRRHVAGGGDVHHRLDDRRGCAGAGDVLDEGAIDLDLVERETLQVAQRGIAGAEIVQRDPNAELAQLVQHVQRRFVVANEHGLGDLELQPRRRQGREAASAAATFSASVWLLNCTGETLTATRT